MKEAAGEANMTVVTIVLIAIVLGAGTLIVTNMMKGMKDNPSSKCGSCGYTYDNVAKKCIDSDGTKIDVPAAPCGSTSGA